MDPSSGLVDRLTGLPPGWLYLAAGALLAAEVGVLAGILVSTASTMAFGRTLVARVAGAVGVPYRRFVLFNALGVAVWVPGTVLVGYGVGVSYSRLAAVVGPAAGLVLVAAVVVLAGRWLHRRLRSSPSGYAGSVPPPGPDPAERGAPDLRPDTSKPGPGVRALHRRLRPVRFSPLRQPRRPTGPVGRRPAPAGREAPGRSAAGDGD